MKSNVELVKTNTYSSLINLLTKRQRVKLTHNTYLEKDYNNSLVVTLHGNKIAKITKDNKIEIIVAQYWSGTRLTCNRLTDCLGIPAQTVRGELHVLKQFPIVVLDTKTLFFKDLLEEIYIPYSSELAKEHTMFLIRDRKQVINNIKKYDKNELTKIGRYLQKIGYKHKIKAKMSVYITEEGIEILDYTPGAFNLRRYKNTYQQLFIDTKQFLNLKGLYCSFLFVPPTGILERTKLDIETRFKWD